MAKKKSSQKKLEVTETLELDDTQASQVKGGGLWQQALFTNDTITSKGNPVNRANIKK